MNDNSTSNYADVHIFWIINDAILKVVTTKTIQLCYPLSKQVAIIMRAEKTNNL